MEPSNVFCSDWEPEPNAAEPAAPRSITTVDFCSMLTVAVSVLALTALTSDAVSALAEMPLVKAVSDAKATLVVARKLDGGCGGYEGGVGDGGDGGVSGEGGGAIGLGARGGGAKSQSQNEPSTTGNEMLGWVPPCHNVQVLEL